MKIGLFVMAGLMIAILASCIPEGVKEKMKSQMTEMSKMLADQEFKKGIAFIELHKVRTGVYPNSLSELQFLSTMDSAMHLHLQYARLDSGYELNLKFEFPTSFTATDVKPVELEYPDEFWKGLGCVKSNTMKSVVN